MDLPVLFKRVVVKIGNHVFGSDGSQDNISIGDRVRFAKVRAFAFWQYARKASDDYRTALDMSVADIETLGSLGGCVKVKLSSGIEVCLVPKHTCCCNYGGSWEYLLQPRINDLPIPSLGCGTSFIAALPAEANELIIDSIRRKEASIVQQSFWP